MDETNSYDISLDFDQFSSELRDARGLKTRPLSIVEGFKAERSVSFFSFMTVMKFRAAPFKAETTNESLSRPGRPELFSFQLLKSSSAELCQDDRKEYLNSGGMAVLDSRISGSAAFYDDISGLEFLIPIEIWKTIAALPPAGGSFVIQEGSAVSRILRYFTLEMSQTEPNVSQFHKDLLARQFVELISLCLVDNAKGLPGTMQSRVRVARIKEFIGQNYHNPNLNVGVIAENFNISNRLLAVLFSGIGETVMDYVWNVRISRAAELLLSADNGLTSVKDICYRVGFKYPSHFASTFRKKYGTTPSEYRYYGESKRQNP